MNRTDRNHDGQRWTLDTHVAKIRTAATFLAVTLAAAACTVPDDGLPTGSLAPTPPSGVTATADDGFVKVTWTDQSDDETGFVVYRSVGAAPGAVGAAAATEVGSVDADTESFDDFTADPSAAYGYSVAAVGSSGTGDAIAAEGDAVAPRAIVLSADLGTGGPDVIATALARYEADRPAITVDREEGLAAADRLATYRTLFADGTHAYDVVFVDTVWIGELSPHLVDLLEYEAGSDAAEYLERTITHAMVSGELMALPWFVDVGLLYYRTDLLSDYGHAAPPTTWVELETMATEIQDGERGNGNADFWGYVWQGSAYEGLTCDALEWIASSGGGSIIDDGTVTIDNAAAIAAVEMAAAWVDSISPSTVTTFAEEDSRNIFQQGNAAFMRNWPYAYALAESVDSPIAGKVGIAPLPAYAGGASAGTLGGWYLAVTATSSQPEAASDLVRFLTSYDELKARAVEGSFAPSRTALYDDEEVLAALPHFGLLGEALSTAVARPSTPAGAAYADVSNAFFTAVHSVLTGSETAETALAAASDSIASITGLPEGTP